MSGIYIHVPFCKKRCVYCGFYSTTLGAEIRHKYVQSLIKEIDSRKDFLKGAPRSFYFGGGTPSCLTDEELREVLAAIRNAFDTSACKEVTLEANPDDVTPQRVEAFKAMGINRVSLGVQSMDDGELKLLNRRHDAEEACRAVMMLHDGGIRNISIDLIYGLPGQTLQQWEANLSRALALPVAHLSAYALSYEEGTPLYNMRARGEVEDTNDDTFRTMFEVLRERTSGAGFEHYEISNFARPGWRAVHNSSYWTGEAYLGCGPGAHSFDGTRTRRQNTPDVLRYVSGMGNVPYEEELLTPQERYDEVVMTGLRTSEGVNLVAIEEQFGTAKKNYLLRMAEKHIAAGLLLVAGGQLRLTEQGIFVSDWLMSDLMSM